MLLWISLLMGLMQGANAFTLVPSRVKFATDKVALIGAANDCVNAGISAQDLLAAAAAAANETWNSVSTSKMRLELSGVTSANTSADTLSVAAAKGRVNAILIGCSSNTTLFDSASTLAVGSIATSTSGILGIVLVNDALVGGENYVASLSRNELESTLAHEIGHAFGIGHSSDPVALMYYSIGNKKQEHLTQDDWDALTYLYPHENLPGACGTISGNQNDESWWGNFVFGLVLCLLLFSLSEKIAKKIRFKQT